MRIERLLVENFKGFERREFRLHPAFNLVVGVNGSGKTSLLEALSIAAGSWFLGLRGHDTRHIRPEEVRLAQRSAGDDTQWAPQWPCSVEATGVVQDQPITWRRALNGPKGRTTYVDARAIKALAAECDVRVQAGDSLMLPLIAYYGTGRLWNVPREQAQVKDSAQLPDKTELSRLAAYKYSVDPRVPVAELVTWFVRQEWMAFKRGGAASPTFRAVRQALIDSLPGATEIEYDPELTELVVNIEGTRQPFNNLSDGQRCMLALVGDLARKAVTLNPHLGPAAMAQTPGVVLIDELDLHLHPKWQREVIERLRTTFAQLQFICSTHSPFLIQSLRSSEELLMLDGLAPAQLGNRSIADISHDIQGVAQTEMSARYAEMKGVALRYLETLEEASSAPEARLAEYEAQLAAAIGPYADNPAFQALLEFQRVAKLGR